LKWKIIKITGRKIENYSEGKEMGNKRRKVKKEKDGKRSKTEAEDIRRFFKKHDEH
jgi:hypothetical protein